MFLWLKKSYRDKDQEVFASSLTSRGLKPRNPEPIDFCHHYTVTLKERDYYATSLPKKLCLLVWTYLHQVNPQGLDYWKKGQCWWGHYITASNTHFLSMGKTKINGEIMHILLEENEATCPALHSAIVNQQTPLYKKVGRMGFKSNPENLCVTSSQVFCTPSVKYTIWQGDGKSFLTWGDT